MGSNRPTDSLREPAELPRDTAADISGTSGDNESPARLLSSVCHDLKAPLASMVMGTGFLRRVLPPDNAAALRVVEAMHKACDRMHERIVAFSDLAKLQTSEMTLHVAAHELVSLAQQAFEQFRKDASAHAVSVSLQLSPDAASLRVACDADRILQVLRLLTACALRASPDGAEVSMHAGSAEGGAPSFGIHATSARGATRPFTVDLPRPEMALGRGLIELHGGNLTASCDRNGVSLAFTLSAPA
jgi:signal transduction histidine kinase